MPVYNRQHYLKEVLKALKKCSGIERFYISTFEENAIHKDSTTISENNKLLDPIDWIDIRRNINTEVRGCAGNIIRAIDNTCRSSENFVVLEDDIVPAVDFLDFMLWGFKNFDKNTVWVQGYSKNTENALKTQELHNKIHKFQFFVPWGWGASKRLWLEYRKDFLKPIDPKGSWAIPFGIWLMKKKYFGYRCLISRAQNIGEVGTFMQNPKLHKEKVRSEYWYGNINKPVGKFELMDRVEYANPDHYKKYIDGVINNRDFRACFRDWESL